MENNINQRIREILKIKNMTNRSLSKLLGVPEVTLNAKLNGRNRLDIDTFCSICDIFSDISIEWLLTGRGEMFRRNEITVNNAFAHNGAASIYGDANNNNTLCTSCIEKDREIHELQAELIKLYRKNNK